MKILVALLFAGLFWGLVLLVRGLIKELMLFVAEAWHDTEIEQ